MFAFRPVTDSIGNAWVCTEHPGDADLVFADLGDIGRDVVPVRCESPPWSVLVLAPVGWAGWSLSDGALALRIERAVRACIDSGIPPGVPNE